MLKYVSKFFLEIFPSVVATVVGAYIVNHYIMPRAVPDTPKSAAYSKASTDNKASPDNKVSPDNKAVPESHEDQGAIDITPKSDAASAQDAKGQDTKEKPATEKASTDRNVDKPADKPVETVKVAPEKRPSPRERVIVKTAAPPPVPAEAALTTEERRDANELARAAIERLRASPEQVRPVATPAPAPEVREPVRSVSAVPQPQPRAFVPPLPPPVNVKASGSDGVAGNIVTPGVSSPSYPAAVQPAETNRPVPPADVPVDSHPLDLQAAAAPKPSVADDMLSAARSVIHAVVPQ